MYLLIFRPAGRVAQSVTCLTTDADPGVASSIPFGTHTSVEVVHEIISTVILLPSADSFKKSVTRESMCTKYWLADCSSLPRKKVWLGESDKRKKSFDLLKISGKQCDPDQPFPVEQPDLGLQCLP